MATTGGSAVVPSFPSSSYLSCKSAKSISTVSLMVRKLITSSHWNISCSAVQESPTPTATTETKEKKAVKSAAAKEEPSASAPAPAAKEEASAPAPAPAKPKSSAKAPVKPLPQMMEEDVIPSLESILEAQDDISEIELSFGDNRLEGSFLNKNITHSFWAFFPDGVLTGPKGFSLSSYGSGASTFEPFLVDERKITAKHVVFWVEKRLAAQGILPVWKNE